MRAANKSQATNSEGDAGAMEGVLERIEDLQVQVDRLDGKLVDVRQDQMKLHGDPRVLIQESAEYLQKWC